MGDSGTSLGRGASLGRFNVRHLYLLVPWVALEIYSFRPITDNSFLWHVQAGILQLDRGAVLNSDPFSFAFAGEPWRTQSWLAELGYGWLFRQFELRFVGWWVLTMASVMLVAVGIRTFQRSGSVGGTTMVLLGVTWMGIAFLAPRPVVISFMLLGLLALVVENRALLWTVPLLIWIWAAVHGSFIVGIAYLVLQGLRTRRRQYAHIAIGALAVSSFTAHGHEIWWTLWDFFINRDALELITEWAPPDVTSIANWPFVIAIVLILVRLANQRIEARDLWLIAPFLVFGLTSQRALYPALVVLAPWTMSPSRADIRERAPQTSFVPLVGIALMMVVLPLILRQPAALFDEERFPVEAAGGLTTSAVLHDEVTGGYLILARSEHPVLVDDRAELYGREFYDQIRRALAGHPSWKVVVASYEISEALLNRDDGLVDALVEAGWATTYRDGSFVVLQAP